MKKTLLIIALAISCGFLFTLLAQEDDLDTVPNESSDPVPKTEQENNICNKNGICDAGETATECPGECLQADFTIDGGIPPFDGK